MCIAGSIGPAGKNDKLDVIIFQKLFNLNIDRFAEPKPPMLTSDGSLGEKSIDAIRLFETKVMRLPTSDAMLAPDDATVKALLDGLAPGISKEKLGIIMPVASSGKIDRYYEPLVVGMNKHEINTPLRMAHFLAQLAHESGSFLYAEEIADGFAYEGRVDLGNLQPGDGRRFKGRGLIQLTGRANYAAYSQYAGIDCIGNPAVVASDPFIAIDVACWFWSKHKLNALADADNVIAITKKINGGQNGLEDRKHFLARAKGVLGA